MVQMAMVARGNLTLIGLSAGVVADGISAKYGHRLSFNQWFKIDLLFTIMTVLIGMVSPSVILCGLISKSHLLDKKISSRIV